MKFEQAFYTAANKLLNSSSYGIGVCAASSTDRSFLSLADSLAGRYQRERKKDYTDLAADHIEQMIAYSTEFRRFTVAIVGPRERRAGDNRPNGMCQVLIPEKEAKPEEVLLDFREYANMTVPEGYITETVDIEAPSRSLQDILATYQISKEALASLLDLVYMSLLKHRKTIVIRDDGETVKSEQAALDISRLVLLLVPQEMQNRISIGLHAVLNFERVLLWYGTEKELGQAGGECAIWDNNPTECTHMFAYDIAEMAMQATSDEEVCHQLNEIMADYQRNVTPSINEQEMELVFARRRLEKGTRENPADIFMSPIAWSYLRNRARRGEQWSEDTYLMYICQATSEQVQEGGQILLNFLTNKLNKVAEWEILSELKKKQWIQATVHCADIYTDIRWENYLWICRQIKNSDAKSWFMNELAKLDNSPVNREFEDVEGFCKAALAYSGWKNSDYWDKVITQATGYLNHSELQVEAEVLLIKTMNDTEMDDSGRSKWKEALGSIMLERITSQNTIQDFSHKYTQYKDYLDLDKDNEALLAWGKKAFENGDDEALLLKTMNAIDSGAWKKKISPVMLQRVTSQETVDDFSQTYKQYKNYLDDTDSKKKLLEAMGELYQKPVLTDRERLSELAAKITTSDDEWKNIALSALKEAVTAKKLVELCTEDEIKAVEKRYIGAYYQQLVSVRTVWDARGCQEKLTEIAGWIEQRAGNTDIKPEDKQALHDTFDEWEFNSLDLQKQIEYVPKTGHMFEYYCKYFGSDKLEAMELDQLVTIAERLKDCKKHYPYSKVDIADLKTRIWKKTKTETSSSINGYTEKDLLRMRLKIWYALHEGSETDFDFFSGVLENKSYDELKDILESLKAKAPEAAKMLFATTPNYTKEKNGKTVYRGKKIPLCYLIWFTCCEEEYFPEHLLKEMTEYYTDKQSKDKVNNSWKLDELRAQNLWRIKDQSEEEDILNSVINYLCLLVWDNVKTKETSPNKQDVLRKELSPREEQQKEKINGAIPHYDEYVKRIKLPEKLKESLDAHMQYMKHIVKSGESPEERKGKNSRTESSGSCEQTTTSEKNLREDRGTQGETTFGQQAQSANLNQDDTDLIRGFGSLTGENGNVQIEDTFEKNKASIETFIYGRLFKEKN